MFKITCRWKSCLYLVHSLLNETSEVLHWKYSSDQIARRLSIIAWVSPNTHRKQLMLHHTMQETIPPNMQPHSIAADSVIKYIKECVHRNIMKTSENITVSRIFNFRPAVFAGRHKPGLVCTAIATAAAATHTHLWLELSALRESPWWHPAGGEEPGLELTDSVYWSFCPSSDVVWAAETRGGQQL